MKRVVVFALVLALLLAGPIAAMGDVMFDCPACLPSSHLTGFGICLAVAALGMAFLLQSFGRISLISQPAYPQGSSTSIYRPRRPV